MKKIALTLFTAALVAASYVGVVSSQSSSSQPAPGLMPRGTAALPGMYFAGDRNAGFYWVGSDNVGVTTNGVARLFISATGISVPNNLPYRALDNGGNSRAVVRVDASNNLAVGDADNLLAARLDINAGTSTRFYQNAVEVARIQPDGTFSIGKTADSVFQLDVNGPLAHNGTQAYWLKGVTTLTSGSGTYTVPAGVRAINVRMAGGGGGGGYARATTTSGAKAAGGGGQGGHFVEFWLTGLSASYSYGVGAAGAGGIGSSSTASTSGGNTTFGTFTANGGARGTDVQVTTAVYQFGVPGLLTGPSTNTGNTVNMSGSEGSPAWFADTTGNFYLSKGGGNPLSTGSTQSSAVTSNSAVGGTAGTGCGAGGTGAGGWRAAGDQIATGGAGTAGCIIIEEYF